MGEGPCHRRGASGGIEDADEGVPDDEKRWYEDQIDSDRQVYTPVQEDQAHIERCLTGNSGKLRG